MAAFVRMSMSIALLASLAGCVSATPVVDTPPIVEKEKAIRIEPRDGGWKFEELADYVHRVAGMSILWESSAATFRLPRVFVGPVDIPERDLPLWMQAVAGGCNLTLVPIPHRAHTRRQWLSMDTWDSDARTCAVLVDEADIPVYANRAALRIVTTLRTTQSDAMMVCDQVRTRIPALNRVYDLGSAYIVVCGAAPAVAAAQREVERFNAETRPDAPPASPIDRSEP